MPIKGHCAVTVDELQTPPLGCRVCLGLCWEEAGGEIQRKTRAAGSRKSLPYGSTSCRKPLKDPEYEEDSWLQKREIKGRKGN